MTRRLLIPNLVLGLLIVAAAFRFQDRWSEFESTHDVEAVLPDEAADLRALAAPPQLGTAGDTATARLNPFSFDRTDVPLLPPQPEEPEEVVEPVQVVTAELPVLYGTIRLGGDQVALLAPQGVGRSQQVRVGERVDGWELVEIGRKQVVVAANGVSRTVLMNDPTAGIERVRSRTLVTETERSAPVIVAPTAPPATAAVAPGGGPAPAASPIPPPRPGTRVIQTPFGEVVVEDR